jgi:hypothetical protein
MKRLPLVLLLIAACQVPTGPNTNLGTQSTTGPTGNQNNTNTTTTDPKTVCESTTGSCAKWLTQCKTKDCKVIADSTQRASCQSDCDTALDSCYSACESETDPTTFDAKASDWDGKPTPPKATSDTCGAADQQCCTDPQYDTCQTGLLQLSGSDGQGNTLCGCVQKCTKNILDQKNKGADDCDANHVCIAQDYTQAPSTKNPLSCVPAMCDATQASGNGHTVDAGCQYPQPRCQAPIPTKKAWGLCNPHCIPHMAELGCATGEVCYATYTTVMNQIMPLNVCGTKNGTVADGAACTFTFGGDPTAGLTATENCAANEYCDLSQPAGANRKCRTNCGVEGSTGITGDSQGCNAAVSHTCNEHLSNVTGITGVTGVTAGQLLSVAQQQGPMFYCAP